MNPNQIKIDIYRELIEWNWKNFVPTSSKDSREWDAWNQHILASISYLKGRIEELENNGKN